MLLLIEIALTVWACIRLSKAGKSWAYGLIPLGTGFSVSFLIGFAVGLSHGNTAAAVPIGLFLDVIIVISLVWVAIANKPKALP